MVKQNVECGMQNDTLREFLSSWRSKKLASDNYFCAKIPALPQNEALARVMVVAFMANEDPIMEIADDVKTAVSEAVTNCIIHGYDKQAYDAVHGEDFQENSHGSMHEIKMECFLYKGELYVEISDDGVGIADVKKAMEPLYTSKPDMDRSGMGFAFMEAFMDFLYVDSKLGCGTSVYMIKRVSGD